MAPMLEDMIAAFPVAARAHMVHLVVPNWQAHAPLEGDPGFAARLRELEGTMVLHGWTHSAGADLANRVFYGHDNRSEFARLDATETRRRLAQGKAMLHRCLDQPPRWFCAPRWQGNRHLETALHALDFQGVMTLRGLNDLQGRQMALPALNFDNGGRAVMIALAQALRHVQIRSLLARRRPFRLVLHPDDLSRPMVIAQFRRLVRQLEDEGWQPLGLDAFAARMKAATA